MLRSRNLSYTISNHVAVQYLVVLGISLIFWLVPILNCNSSYNIFISSFVFGCTLKWQMNIFNFNWSIIVLGERNPTPMAYFVTYSNERGNFVLRPSFCNNDSLNIFHKSLFCSSVIDIIPVPKNTDFSKYMWKYIWTS